MTLWIAISACLLVFWGLHAQRLKERQKQLEETVNSLQQKKSALESSLTSRSSRMDVLFSAVNDVVVRLDRKGRVTSANPRAREIFRMQDDALPQSIVSFYRDPDWQEAFSSALNNLPDTSELPNIHIDNRVLAPRLISFGRKQALMLCVDITEKYRIEEQRKSLFANLMHDLKTPLTSILGYARSIEAFGDDAEVRKEAVAVIANESVRANEFLDSLLTLEHVESFKPDVDARCYFSEVVDSVLNGFSAQIEANEIIVVQSADLSEIEVKMAESDLHRILDNLIENALRYTPKQSQILLSGALGQGVVRFEIVDQGDGVSEKELPRLTERFYRGDQARANVTDVGHGLGLAIVKELMEKYGGELELANHDEHGLSAALRLPIAY